MSVKAFLRGHPIVFQDGWKYEDGVPIAVERACS